MRSVIRAALALGLGVALLATAHGTSTARPVTGLATSGWAADAVLSWNANAGDAARAACIAPTDNPLHESRMYAMTHVAIHDSLNAIDRRYRPYAYTAHAPADASPDAAVAAAARNVLVPVLGQLTDPFTQECIDAGVASVEADYAAAIAQIPDGVPKTRGIAVGEAAAAAIVALRADDGADTPLLVFDYPQGTEPGEYRFTPGQTFVFAPGWQDVTPFVLRDSSQYLPGPPYPIGSRKYAADFREVKALGGDDVTTPSARTPEQTEIAYFWLESSPLLWNRIARTVADDQHLNLWESARLFGLLNIALADGYVHTFDTYFHYDRWRPVTAIHEAATDGNRWTTADPTWAPLVGTPPVPEYDSGHSVQGGAAAAVLAGVLGTDRVSFAACSLLVPEGTCDDPEPVLRQFRSFSQAAGENADSRVYIGFHFRDAVETGTDQGRRIGTTAIAHYLQPVGAQ